MEVLHSKITDDEPTAFFVDGRAFYICEVCKKETTSITLGKVKYCDSLACFNKLTKAGH